MAKAKHKVLLIEDEVVLQRNLSRVLDGPYEVMAAGTGAEGIALARSEKPDLILLDVMLPDTTGVEVITKLKANSETENIPVVVLTNLSDQETVSKILKAGSRDYIVKSDWSITDIAEKVTSYLR